MLLNADLLQNYPYPLFHFTLFAILNSIKTAFSLAFSWSPPLWNLSFHSTAFIYSSFANASPSSARTASNSAGSRV